MACVPAGTIRADVAVMGGGLAGLSAAIGFARRGRRVCVLERDSRERGRGGPDLVFDGWDRPGVAHFRQPHNFLGLGRRTLLDEAPDVLDRVVETGAFENRQYELLPGDPEPDDEALVSVCTRRPVFESALRTVAEAEPNVTFESGARIAGLTGSARAGERHRSRQRRTHDGRPDGGGRPRRRRARSDVAARLVARRARGSSRWRSVAASAASCTTAGTSAFALASRCRRSRRSSAGREARSGTSSSSCSSGTTGRSRWC